MHYCQEKKEFNAANTFEPDMNNPYGIEEEKMENAVCCHEACTIF